MTDDDFKPDLTERLAPGVRVVKKPHRLRRVVVLAVLAGFIALVVYAFSQSGQSAGEGNVPVIKADTDPIKVRPVDAGGVEIPHQDKLVYEQIAGKGVESMPERLMPEPEQPVQQTPIPAADAVSDGVDAAPVTEPVSTASAQPETTVDKPPVSKPETITPPAVMAPIIPPQQTPSKTPAAKEPALPATTKPPANAAKAVTGSYRVQVAALPDNDEAKKTAQKLGKKLTKALGGRELIVRRAEIPNKGTFYRIQADGFADRAEAAASCDKIKSLQQSCMVVAP